LEVVYLDDFLLIGSLSEDLQKRLFEIKEKLEMSGLPVNIKKSIIQPTRQLDYLGYSMDFSDNVLLNQPQKIQNLKSWIEQFDVEKGCSVSDWISFKGRYYFELAP
jgi:hypothetical protein